MCSCHRRIVIRCNNCVTVAGSPTEARAAEGARPKDAGQELQLRDTRFAPAQLDRAAGPDLKPEPSTGRPPPSPRRRALAATAAAELRQWLRGAQIPGGAGQKSQTGFPPTGKQGGSPAGPRTRLGWLRPSPHALQAGRGGGNPASPGNPGNPGPGRWLRPSPHALRPARVAPVDAPGSPVAARHTPCTRDRVGPHGAEPTATGAVYHSPVSDCSDLSAAMEHVGRAEASEIGKPTAQAAAEVRACRRQPAGEEVARGWSGDGPAGGGRRQGMGESGGRRSSGPRRAQNPRVGTLDLLHIARLAGAVGPA